MPKKTDCKLRDICLKLLSLNYLQKSCCQNFFSGRNFYRWTISVKLTDLTGTQTFWVSRNKYLKSTMTAIKPGKNLHMEHRLKTGLVLLNLEPTLRFSYPCRHGKWQNENVILFFSIANLKICVTYIPTHLTNLTAQ